MIGQRRKLSQSDIDRSDVAIRSAVESVLQAGGVARGSCAGNGCTVGMRTPGNCLLGHAPCFKYVHGCLNVMLTDVRAIVPL